LIIFINFLSNVIFSIVLPSLPTFVDVVRTLHLVQSTHKHPNIQTLKHTPQPTSTYTRFHL
jgi:hypothetical protein